jgi:hypothetical protein
MYKTIQFDWHTHVYDDDDDDDDDDDNDDDDDDDYNNVLILLIMFNHYYYYVSHYRLSMSLPPLATAHLWSAKCALANKLGCKLALTMAPSFSAHAPHIGPRKLADRCWSMMHLKGNIYTEQRIQYSSLHFKTHYVFALLRVSLCIISSYFWSVATYLCIPWPYFLPRFF